MLAVLDSDQAPTRPVADRSALDVARADHQIRTTVDGVEQAVQLLGRVAAVGVHLDQDRVLATQTPREAGQVRRAQTVLGRAVHDVHPVRVGEGQLVGELAGAVRAAVVDDQNVHVGTGVLHPSDDQRQVLPLVVGGDDDQSALTWAFPRARARRHVSSSIFRRPDGDDARTFHCAASRR